MYAYTHTHTLTFENVCSIQSGIVYCFTRKESEDVAELLRASGIIAAAYHADLDFTVRSKVCAVITCSSDV